MRIDVVGSKELHEALLRQGLAARPASVTVLRRICVRAVMVARVLAPDDPETGSPDLKGSIRASKPRVNRQTGVVSCGVVAGGTLVRHAPAQEAGKARVGRGGALVSFRHSRGGESPYLWPPFAKEAESAPAELMDELDRQVKSAL